MFSSQKSGYFIRFKAEKPFVGSSSESGVPPLFKSGFGLLWLGESLVPKSWEFRSGFSSRIRSFYGVGIPTTKNVHQPTQKMAIFRVGIPTLWGGSYKTYISVKSDEIPTFLTGVLQSTNLLRFALSQVLQSVISQVGYPTFLEWVNG